MCIGHMEHIFCRIWQLHQERFRMFLGEFTLVVCFIAGAFSPSDPNRVTPWLNLWSLYAYCFHVMWYRLFGSPYGAIITFAGIPMFWAIMHSAASKSTKSESQEPKDSKAWDNFNGQKDVHSIWHQTFTKRTSKPAKKLTNRLSDRIHAEDNCCVSQSYQHFAKWYKYRHTFHSHW